MVEQQKYRQQAFWDLLIYAIKSFVVQIPYSQNGFESYASFSDNNDDDINVMVDGVPGEKYIDSGDYHISMNGEVIFKSGVYILRVK